MKPYYEQDGITIWHGDWREVVTYWTGGKAIIDQADVVVTDPPYGTNAYEWDMLPHLEFSVPRAVFGRLPEMLPLLHPSPDLVVTWWPSNGSCIGRSRVGVHREAHVIAFWKPIGELRKATASPRSLALGWDSPAHEPDVWTDAHPHGGFVKSEYNHPTEKPRGLMRKVITLLGHDGLILDPFMGSGTTLRAAKDLGRKAIGIEIEERYCEIAAKRMSQAVLL